MKKFVRTGEIGMDEEKLDSLDEDQVKDLIRGRLESLDDEELEGIAGGESYYDAMGVVYYGLYRMYRQGATKEEAHDWAVERCAENMPRIENYINAEIHNMWDLHKF